MEFDARQARVKALDRLEERAKQFRGREAVWPFRVPHEPVTIDPSDFNRRPVLRMDWPDASWTLWSLALPSGILVYGDDDGREARVLASVKRGSASEADGFFLERLSESRGELFGIEMHGPPPDRVRTSIGDREFLADVFVALFEGTDAAQHIGADPADFRLDVIHWLDRVLTCPLFTKRQPRIEEAERQRGR
jgi:hypothetical protein